MRSFAPQSIKAKGFLLICIPLVVEVLMAIFLLYLQRGYQEKLSTERTARDIVTRTNDMWLRFSEGLAQYADYAIFGGKESPAGLRQKLEEDYSRITPLMGGQKRLSESLSEARRDIMDALDRVESFKRVQSTDDPGSQIEAWKADGNIFQTLQQPINSFNGRVLEFERAEVFYRSEAANEVRKTETMINTFLIGMVLGSIILALILFLYFSNSIIRRLNLLVENTDRFRQGQQLKDLLSGNDELALLDGAFHRMAAEISEAQQMKQQMVATISHDVRTPLAAISVFLELLTMGAMGTAQGDIVNGATAAEQDVNEVIVLITVLLDLEKIQAGRMEISPHAIPVDQVIERSIDKFSSSFSDDRIRINSEPTAIQIMADTDRIVQVLEILMRSAVALANDFTLNIQVNRVSEAVEIRISHAGTALDEETIASILDGKTETPLGSLALGFPLCCEILKLHNGNIGITPAGNGNIFWIASVEPKSRTS